MAAVFFDVDGTLVRWTDESEAVRSSTFEHCLQTSKDAWIAHYEDRFFDHFGTFTAAPIRRAFADVCQRFDLAAAPDELAETLVARELAAVDRVPGVEPVLSALADRHTLGILTDGLPAVQFGKVRERGLREYFDVTVASHGTDVRALKPDAAIHEAARARTEADTAVMVGEGRKADVTAARSQGFVPVHLDGTATELAAPDFETLATLLH